MHQDQWIIQATLESFEAESNERIKQREWVYWVAAAGWGLFEVTRSKMIIFSSPEEEIPLLSPHPLFQFQLICCCSYCIRITPRSEKETLQDSQILNAKTPLLKVFIAHCFKERQTFIWNIYKHLGDDGDAIYKLSTHNLHTIYTVSTQYLLTPDDVHGDGGCAAHAGAAAVLPRVRHPGLLQQQVRRSHLQDIMALLFY